MDEMRNGKRKEKAAAHEDGSCPDERHRRLRARGRVSQYSKRRYLSPRPSRAARTHTLAIPGHIPTAQGVCIHVSLLLCPDPHASPLVHPLRAAAPAPSHMQHTAIYAHRSTRPRRLESRAHVPRLPLILATRPWRISLCMISPRTTPHAAHPWRRARISTPLGGAAASAPTSTVSYAAQRHLAARTSGPDSPHRLESRVCAWTTPPYLSLIHATRSASVADRAP
ncbi:hypothetical protein B0H19DRAFT_1247683 [Mycena capillaripes]|nr:hypothetical protein B0H19DRAFT_1247683 [Mycena capillaripes]